MKAIFKIGPVEQEIFWEWGAYSNRKENEQRWASIEPTSHEKSHIIEWRDQSSDGVKRFTK
jgi:hypothetical protein